MSTLISLRKRPEFLQVSSSKYRFLCDSFIFQWLPKSASDQTRTGLVVTKKIGCSVVRNRVKRRLREALRVVLESALCGDYVVVARRPILDQKFDILLESLKKGIRSFVHSWNIHDFDASKKQISSLVFDRNSDFTQDKFSKTWVTTRISEFGNSREETLRQFSVSSNKICRTSSIKKILNFTPPDTVEINNRHILSKISDKPVTLDRISMHKSENVFNKSNKRISNRSKLSDQEK